MPIIVESHGGRLWAAPAIPMDRFLACSCRYTSDGCDRRRWSDVTGSTQRRGPTAAASGSPRSLDHLDEFRHGAGFQFAHDLTAVQLDRHDAQPIWSAICLLRIP